MLTQPWMPVAQDLGDSISAKHLADLAAKNDSLSFLVINQTLKGLLELKQQEEIVNSVFSEHVGTMANLVSDKPSQECDEDLIAAFLGSAEDVQSLPITTIDDTCEANSHDLMCTVFGEMLKQTILEVLEVKDTTSTLPIQKKLKFDAGNAYDGKREENKDRRGSENPRSFEFQRFRKILGLALPSSNQQIQNGG